MPTLTDTQRERMRTPLVRYLEVQKLSDARLANLLQGAANDAKEHLARIEASDIGGEIRRAQVRQAQAAINKRLAQAWSDIGQQVRADRALAAAAAAEANMDPLRSLFQAAGYNATEVDTLIRSQRATAMRGVENAISRVTVSQKPLSDRVWKSGAMTRTQLDRTITSGLARGLSARELANDVRDFINPDTPGGVRYAAERLARTELNNAFHATQVQQAQASPFVAAMKWELSGSHPRPDACNEYADSVHYEGGEAGVFRVEDVPAKPHPNCLCYCTPEVPSRDAFLDSFQRGEYNDWLVENGSTPVPGTTPPRAPAAPKKATPAAPKKAAPAPAKNAAPTPAPKKAAAKKAAPAPPPEAPKGLPFARTAPGARQQGMDALASRGVPEELTEAVWNARQTNPRFLYAKEHQINCQRVVHAFEARMRGYDVEALPAPAKVLGGAADNLPYGTRPGGYMDLMDGQFDRASANNAFIMKRGTDPAAMKEALKRSGIPDAKWADGPAAYVKAETDSWPVGARGIIRFSRSSGAGHTFSVVKTKKGVYCVDAQSGDWWTLAKTPYWKEVARSQADAFSIARVDDLDWKPGAAEKTMKQKGT